MGDSVKIWVTAACILSSGIWLTAGLYKLTHATRMIGVIRNHSVPAPFMSFWLAVAVEIGGSILMITQRYLWVAALCWLAFLVVATPMFHGKLILDGAIDYPQLVQVAKNVSIAGGLIALIILDGTILAYFARF